MSSGWAIVARLPFTPLRATDEFHSTLADRSNTRPILTFYFLSTILFALFPTYLAWIKRHSGSFFVGFAIILAAAVVNLFLYVLFVDMTADFKLRRRLGFQGLLSAAAISGVFSLLGGAVFEAGTLGLVKFRYAIPIALGLLALWQGVVEILNIRRLYGTGVPNAVALEVVARTLSLFMGLSFLGFVSGQARPWRQWQQILNLFR